MAQSMSDIQLTRKPPELLIEDTGNKPKLSGHYNKMNSKSNFSNETRGTYNFQSSFNQQGNRRAHSMGLPPRDYDSQSQMDQYGKSKTDSYKTYPSDRHNVSSDFYAKCFEDRHSYEDQSGTNCVERNTKLYKEGQMTSSGENYIVSSKTEYKISSGDPQGSPTEFRYVHQCIEPPKDDKRSAYMNEYPSHPVRPDHSEGKAHAKRK